MKTIRTIILLCLLATVISCTPRGIISKRKMAAINADMFLLDQYAGADRAMKPFTDTVAIYKALLRSYGCTAAQYTASVDYYLQNTRDMTKILEMTEAILKKREGKILRHIEVGAKKNDTTLLKESFKHPRKRGVKGAGEEETDNNQ